MSCPDHRPVIVAHKANRLKLLRKYLVLGVPIIEIDVSVQNGQLVVLHGVDFGDFGAIRGGIMKVGYMLIEHRDPLWRPIPLNDYLSFLEGRVGLWLDVKTRGAEGDAVDAAKDHGVYPILVSTAHHDILKPLKKSEPSVKVFLGNVTFTPVDPVGLVKATGADGLSIEYRYITREVVDKLHKAQLLIAAWTVNRPRMAEDLINLGCDYIITDVPEKIMPLLKTRG